jgi:hypothetical protein
MENKVLKCVFCNTTRLFICPKQLRDHIRIKHPDKLNSVVIPKVECELCNKFYSNITRHVRRMHSLEPADILFRENEKKQSINYYHDHKEQQYARSKQWRIDNLIKSKESQRKSYMKHKNKICEKETIRRKEMTTCKFCHKSLTKGYLWKHINHYHLNQKDYYDNYTGDEKEIEKEYEKSVSIENFKEKIELAIENNKYNSIIEEVRHDVVLEF